MIITPEQLLRIMPAAGSKAAIFAPFINAALTEFDISGLNQVQYFLANVADESGDLQHVEENLNYSALGLCKTWPHRFPNLAAAQPYARHPEKIANHVYAGREGNGDEASGDGWRHRGAGLIELTFKNNQAACADHFGIAIEQIGDWLRTPEGAARSAAWFWVSRGCNALADKGDFDGCCDVINIGRKTAAVGDSIGYADRLHHLQLENGVIA